MCTNAVVRYVISKPGSLMIQIGGNRLLQLCQKNRYSRGFANLSGYLGKIFFEEKIKKNAHLQVQKNYGSATRASSYNGTLPGTLTKKQAKELVDRLPPIEREIFMSALKECQSMETKAEFEGQLASFQWRNKFGRPSAIPSLGEVDPTGSYCAFPDDWLHGKYVETVPKPTKQQLRQVMIYNAIPFIGFGFLDNFIMIIAGDLIEMCVGCIIVVSTMTAAALGNTISDIMGIGSAYYVESAAQKIGFKPPKLTLAQLNLPASRMSANIGRVGGVTIGCILGMIPLPFMHHDDKKEESKNKINPEKNELKPVDKKTN